MPQALLPIFPGEAAPINELLSFQAQDGQIYYFHGMAPVFSHHKDDHRSFRMFTSQLVINGNCKQMEIVRAFGISPISVKRYVKKYREGGPGAFFQRPKARKAHVLTPEVLQQSQDMLEQGMSRSAAAAALGIKADTFSKAVRSGRLVEPKKNRVPSQ